MNPVKSLNRLQACGHAKRHAHNAIPDVEAGDRYIPKSFRVWLMGVITIAVLLVHAVALNAQETDSPGNPVNGFPVVLDHQILFQVKQGIPNVVTAEERAGIINERLENIANDSTIAIESIQIEEQTGVSVVKAEDIILFTVRDRDLEGNQS